MDIRAYRPADLDALYRICLLTGASGGDATSQYADPRLLGHYYAAPYPRHDPDLCLVLASEAETCGYVLGTADSFAFRDWAEAEWFPPLRRRYVMPAPADTSREAELIRKLHAGFEVPDEARAYPAHLHIDLLPCAQGRGWGRELMRRFLERLRTRGCPAVHLGVSEANTRAIAFYEHLGFQQIRTYPGARLYGLRLDRAPTAA